MNDKQKALLKAFAETENGVEGTVNGVTHTDDGEYLVWYLPNIRDVCAQEWLWIINSLFVEEAERRDSAQDGEVISDNESFLGKIKRKIFGWDSLGVSFVLVFCLSIYF